MASEDNVSLLPDVPLRHVLKYLDYISILNVSEVSDRLHDFIDKEKLKLHLDKICIRVESEKLILFLSFEENSIPIHRIILEDRDENSTLNDICKENKKGSIEYIENVENMEGYLDDFYKDFHTILKHQNHLLQEFLFIILHDFEKKNDEKKEKICSRFFTKLNDVLKERNRSLQVFDFHVTTIEQHQVVEALKYLDPATLRSISLRKYSIHDRIFDMNEIVQLDQFKRAEWFNLDTFRTSFSGSMETFTHLSNICFSLNSITTDDLIILKEAFLQNPNFQGCNISCQSYDDHDFSRLSAKPFEEVDMCCGRIVTRTTWILQDDVSDRALSLTTDFGAIEFCNIPSLSDSEYSSVLDSQVAL